MKVTKAMIKREIQELKNKQIRAIRIKGNEQVRKEKLSMLKGYNNLFDEITRKANDLCKSTDELVSEIRKNEELEPYILEISSRGRLLEILKDEDKLKEYLISNISFSKSNVQTIINNKEKEVNDIAGEWNKLLTQIDNITLKEVKQFLIDNKIELECMKEKPVTTLVVQDINLNKLMFKEEK